jgi:hypothetical protein
MANVLKYFGFIKAIDGPATKTNLDMTKATYKLCLKSCANKGLTNSVSGKV